jgi:AcrR family transcriptional regulator
VPSLSSSKPSVVPRAGLTPELVVNEAARLVDEVGRERLTLSELAKRLGVAQPSLYKHVDGLDGLNRLLAIRVLCEVGGTMRRASTGKAGEDAISALAAAYRTYALSHPGRYAYVVRAPAADDAALEAAAAEILSIFDDVFAGYGITGSDAVDAARFVRSTLHGFVSLELGGGFGLPHSADTSFQRLVAATNRAITDW